MEKQVKECFREGEVQQVQKIRAPEVPSRSGTTGPQFQDLSGHQDGQPQRGPQVRVQWGGRALASELQPPNFISQASNTTWRSPQGQMTMNYLASNKKQCLKKNILKGGISQVSPEASSCLFSPEELRKFGSQETSQMWLGQPIHLRARRPETVAMAAKKRTWRPENGVIATQRDGIPGGWPLHQGDLSHCSQEHFNGIPKSQEPYFLKLRKALPWWEKHAPRDTLALIQEGVHPSFPLPEYLESRNQVKSAQEVAQALEVLSEYMEVGAVIKDPPGETRHLVPWFVISKQEKGKEKLRLISDCRIINQFFEPKHFKLDHWKNIFPFLKKGMWAGKIDLKHAYFHLGLADQLKSYMRLKVGDHIFQFNAAAFGLSPLPQMWMQVMKVFQKIWRKKGIMCFIYLDDILVVNTTPQGVEKDLAFMLSTLDKAGMMVNTKKSVLIPSQKVDHLGFSLNLEDGVLEVPKAKIKTVRKELGKILTHQNMTCRKMAAILGNIRSFLMAMPFLRAFTDHMLAFVNQQGNWGWDSPLEIPPALQQEVRELNQLTSSWTGRPFQEKVVVRKLHSDSSNHGWAGVDIVHGTVVQEFWREKNGLHINVKELDAAVQTVKSLAKPKEVVHLSVDNSVAFAYLSRGGGRLPQFNLMMRDFWRWTMNK